MKNSSKSHLLLALGSKIKSKRNELNLSQEQLADICNFDRTYISLLERGKRNISFSNLKKISCGLDTTISELTKEL